ncbi:hypothetical protein HDU98_002824 [Podochytrium sp. JEL0797]|nr:hypothetical protein HDU98_002824 [Podochytrium sp. JEL0797]
MAGHPHDSASPHFARKPPSSSTAALKLHRTPPIKRQHSASSSSSSSSINLLSRKRTRNLSARPPSLLKRTHSKVSVLADLETKLLGLTLSHRDKKLHVQKEAPLFDGQNKFKFEFTVDQDEEENMNACGEGQPLEKSAQAEEQEEEEVELTKHDYIKEALRRIMADEI